MTGEDAGASHGGGHDVLPSSAVLYTFVMLVLGAACKFVAKEVPIPYTAMLLMWGLFMGSIDFFFDTGPVDLSIAAWTGIDPHLFLLIFIPALIFGSAFTINFHTFKRTAWQVLLLAGPGVVLGMGLTALTCRWMLPYGWTWNQCFLVGSILSATDPVAVVALLKELGASKRLGTVIEGESLVNDGTAFVLFLVFFAIEEGTELDAGMVTEMFAQLALGGPALGVAFAIAAVYWLGYVFDDVILEISITLIAAYLCFYVAEEFAGVSGILAVLCLGLYVTATGKDYISPKSLEEVHAFWEILEYLANTLVFVVAGTIIAHDVAQASDSRSTGAEEVLTGTDVGYLILLYLMLTLIRAMVLAILYPALKASAFPGYALSPKDCAVCVWAGLRGAIGLALSLIVKLSPSIDDAFTIRVIFFVGGIAAMTLLINATTMPWLLTALGMNDDSEAFQFAVHRITQDMQEVAIRKLEKMEAHMEGEHLGDPDWKRVVRLADLDADLFSAAGISNDHGSARAKVAGPVDFIDNNFLVSAPSTLSKESSQEKIAQFNEDHPHLGQPYCWVDPVAVSLEPVDAQKSKEDWHRLFRKSLKSGSLVAKRFLESTESHPGEWFTKKSHVLFAHTVIDAARVSSDRERVGHGGRQAPSPPKETTNGHDIEVFTNDLILDLDDDHAQILIEVRTRFLEGVKAGYHEMFEGGVVGRHAKADLHESCDVAIDHAREPLIDWQELSAMQNSISQLGWIQRYQNVPFIGSFVRNYMVKALTVRCECTSAFVHVHQEARVHFERNIQNLQKSVARELSGEDVLDLAQLKFDSWNAVFAESLKAEKEALRNITDIRNVFPEVLRGIKTRQIVLRLLATKEKYLSGLHAQGIIGDKEFQLLNERQLRLLKRARSPFVWLTKDVFRDEHENLGHNTSSGSALQNIGPGLLRWLLAQPGMEQSVKQSSRVFVLQPGDMLYKKGDSIDGIWFVTRGTVTIDLEASLKVMRAQVTNRKLSIIEDDEDDSDIMFESEGSGAATCGVGAGEELSGVIGGLDCLLGVDKRLYSVKAVTSAVAVNLPFHLVKEWMEKLGGFRNRLWKMAGVNAARVYLLDHPRLSKLSVDELSSALTLSSYLLVPEGHQYSMRRGAIVLLLNGRGMLEARDHLIGYVKGISVLGNAHEDLVLHAQEQPIELLVLPSGKEVEDDSKTYLKTPSAFAGDGKYSLRPLMTPQRLRGGTIRKNPLGSSSMDTPALEHSGSHSWGRSGGSLIPRAHKTNSLRAALREALSQKENAEATDVAEEGAAASGSRL